MQAMATTNKISRSLALLSLTVSACGLVNKQDLNDAESQSNNSNNKNTKSEEKVAINVALIEEGGQANLYGGEYYSLVGSSGFVFDISTCKSGYTATGITSIASTKAITLYKYDISCQADLTSFTFGGATYNKQGGGNLAGIAGTTGLFVNASDATDLVMVRAHTVLPSPLSDGQTATYVFQQIKKGSDHNIANYTHSGNLEVLGVESANVTINNVSLTAIDGTSGAATFDVTFQCGTTMTQPAANWICASFSNDSHAIINMSAKLVSDSYGGTITYATAGTIMTAGATAVTNGMKVGGQNRFTVPLTQATGPLYTNKNMILVIQYVEPSTPSLGTSYVYFNVDIGNP